MLDLLLISLMAVFIIDLTDFIPTIFKKIYSWIFDGKRQQPENFEWDRVSLLFHIPFCSLCTTFWAGLIYLLITSQFSIMMIAYVCLLSFLTPVLKTFLIWIKDMLTFIMDKLFKLIGE